RNIEKALHEREAALAEAERLKRDFVGNVSYELRTPLTTILGYSEILERTDEGLSDRALAHVAAVRSAAMQLGRSIHDVLDIAEIDADEMALDPADVDIAELLAECAERWRGQAEADKVAIDVAVPEHIGLIRADPRRLAQVLDHLIENGLRQTPPGGRV